jgi:predicted nucleic acid-binding protein
MRRGRWGAACLADAPNAPVLGICRDPNDDKGICRDPNDDKFLELAVNGLRRR